MMLSRNEFEKNFSLRNLKNIPLSYFRKETTLSTQEFIQPDGTRHTIQMLQTKNPRMEKILKHLFYKKVTVNNEDFYILKFSLAKSIHTFNLVTADEIEEHFDPTTLSQTTSLTTEKCIPSSKEKSQKVIKAAKRHFIQMAIDAKALKKDQFLPKKYENIPFSIMKTGLNSYEVSTRGKEVGKGSLKTSYAFVPIIKNQPPQIDYSTENSTYNEKTTEKHLQAEFTNYTTLINTMSSHTHLLLSLKKYTSPTQEEKIIAEMCDGDLYDLLETLSPKEKITLAIQGAQVLAAVHAAGYVHSDVKPENFLIKTNNETEEKEIRLCDFEFVRPAYRPGGFLGGTPSFTPHELIISSENSSTITITPATDVFSYGATLHELFPLDENARTLIDWDDHRSEENDLINIPQKQEALRKSLDPIHSLIADCIDCDPKKRPSMEEVEKRLEAIRAHERD